MSGHPGLCARNLHRRFDGLIALDAVDVDVAPGEILAVVGPNGSGKSTLVNVLTGMVAPDQGSVQLGGVDITGWKPAALARQGVGRSFQEGRLLEGLSALDNVLVGLHTAAREHASRPRWGGRARRRTRAMIALADVGLVASWHRRARELSPGQRRRVEIARALVGRPRLLCLDEPTAGLTPEDTHGIAALLAGAARATALLIVAHDLDLVGRLATRVLVLDQGTTVAAGAPAGVLADPAVRAVLGTPPPT